MKFHHRARLKAKRRNYWGRDLLLKPENHAKVVDTPKPHCRCRLCANRRKREGASMQELRANQETRSTVL